MKRRLLAACIWYLWNAMDTYGQDHTGDTWRKSLASRISNYFFEHSWAFRLVQDFDQYASDHNWYVG